MDNIVVKASNLHKKYATFEAVKGIDFEITSGSCFGFLGPNGAGKTTTMAMIYCAVQITDGELFVLGLDAKKNPRKIKQNLGVSPQDENLDPDISVYENLLVYGGYFGIKRKILKERITELLNLMQLNDRRKSVIQSLSGGMQRRLLLARALINSPKVLILDEPTTGLDPQARHLIWQKLEHLKRSGTTMVLTTHYMEEASRLCDKLVIMDQGKILEEGSPKDLISRHVGKDVIEVKMYGKKREPLLQLANDIISNFEVVGENILLYPKDSSRLIQKLIEKNSYEFTHRQASLEDVFLKLTGRELRE
ncbi:MAG: ABC transporter [Deltaproteobacteria bacterium RIFCSPHIGHO2_12_FULL_43_9]|nr:MAG: ABC transporter [Deltaproteobacteria bacterium RIFCSPHIGHO2_12_FULL_43_9]